MFHTHLEHHHHHNHHHHYHHVLHDHLSFRERWSGVGFLCNPPPNRTIPQHSAQFFTILHNSAKIFTILDNSAQFHTNFHNSGQFCTILHNATILQFCTILQHSALGAFCNIIHHHRFTIIQLDYLRPKNLPNDFQSFSPQLFCKPLLNSTKK